MTVFVIDKSQESCICSWLSMWSFRNKTFCYWQSHWICFCITANVSVKQQKTYIIKYQDIFLIKKSEKYKRKVQSGVFLCACRQYCKVTKTPFQRISGNEQLRQVASVQFHIFCFVFLNLNNPLHLFSLETKGLAPKKILFCVEFTQTRKQIKESGGKESKESVLALE